MKNPFRWHFVELSNDRGARVWAIRRWRLGYQYMDLKHPDFTWRRGELCFEYCVSDDPKRVLEVYNERILNRSRALSLEQFRRLVMKFRLRGGE